MVVAGLVRVEGFEPPLPEDNCFTGSRDEPYSPHTHGITGLPEQDSNLQSRINNPQVYRLTDRG